jgi:hypothetical protein
MTVEVPSYPVIVMAGGIESRSGPGCFDFRNIHGSFTSAGCTRCTSRLFEIRHADEHGICGANCSPSPVDWLVYCHDSSYQF